MAGRIAIIGGTGKMGQWFATFFKEKGYQVVISGRFPGKTVKTAQVLGVASTDSYSEAVENADIVMVSTPIEATARIITEIASYMSEGSILFDIASVKKGIITALEKAQQSGIRTISVHPLFGPGAKRIKNRRVILIPVGKDTELIQTIRKLFEDDGAIINVIEDAKTHDGIIAYTLALPHFLNILFGTMLSKADFESYKFSGTTLALQLMLTESVFNEDPRLYSTIQMSNDQFRKLLIILLESTQKLARIILNNDTEGFYKLFKDTKVYLSRNPSFEDSYDRLYKALEAIDEKTKE